MIEIAGISVVSVLGVTLIVLAGLMCLASLILSVIALVVALKKKR